MSRRRITDKRRYPGDGLGPIADSPRTRCYYLVFWKSPGQPEKGTVWLWCSPAMKRRGQIEYDYDVPPRALDHRPVLAIARGIKWIATWEDGTSHAFKASPQLTKVALAQIAQRWAVPPATLQKDKGRPFDLVSLTEESHSHVYLVRLLTFDPTADGRAYYKIGKAVSIPKRIKQFGPCQLVAEARLASEKESLAAEAKLHQQFASCRKPETEIFCFTGAQVEVVKAAMAGSATMPLPSPSA
jgi:hypothetical protein